jgi:hypothetical protein
MFTSKEDKKGKEFVFKIEFDLRAAKELEARKRFSSSWNSLKNFSSVSSGINHPTGRSLLDNSFKE